MILRDIIVVYLHMVKQDQARLTPYLEPLNRSSLIFIAKQEESCLDSWVIFFHGAKQKQISGASNALICRYITNKYMIWYFFDNTAKHRSKTKSNSRGY